MSKKLPNYRLCLKDNELDRNGTIGTAWVDEDTGAIAIYLNPGVQLGYEHTCSPMTLRLFPIDRGSLDG